VVVGGVALTIVVGVALVRILVLAVVGDRWTPSPSVSVGSSGLVG
jgi:hypothetical protein